MPEEWAPKAPNTNMASIVFSESKKIRILSDLDAFKNNLAWAQAAVMTAKDDLQIGSANKLGDIGRSFGGSFACVLEMRIARHFGSINNAKGLERIRQLAADARAHGCGNCGELSAVAFMYLHDSGVRPLDWMTIVGGDHQFVLIGRANIDVTQPSTWGDRCVIADPWKDVAAAGSTIQVFKSGTPSPIGVPGEVGGDPRQYGFVYRAE